jgi:hypothetical protein
LENSISVPICPVGLRGSGGKLHNQKFHNLYVSPNILRVIQSGKMRCAGAVQRIGEMRNAYKILAGKFEGKSTLGRPGRRWEDGMIWLRTGTNGGLV